MILEATLHVHQNTPLFPNQNQIVPIQATFKLYFYDLFYTNMNEMGRTRNTYGEKGCINDSGGETRREEPAWKTQA
jgi:hypothetical protein